jgi:D-alanyl-D-alanine dipeptidase
VRVAIRGGQSLVIFSICAVMSALTLAAMAMGQAPEIRDTSISRQMIVVITKNWDDIHGTARRYERSDLEDKWRGVDQPFAVVVGRNGLAWGQGLQPVTVVGNDPKKREGDGKAPAGIFLLTSSFGYSTEALENAQLPYTTLTPTVECVDDPRSDHYNQLFDTKGTAKDWSSSEQMRRSDELYRWGVVVGYNINPPKSGAGSCIFLHIWDGPEQGTAGCTAMEAAHIETLLRWLDPKKSPVLVQLPESEYVRYQTAWALPPKSAQ